MFKVVNITPTDNDVIDDRNFIIEDSFFFTVEHDRYYVVTNNDDVVVGILPDDYHMFFKVGDNCSIEEIDVENLLRLFTINEKFDILGIDYNTNTVNFLNSSDIKSIALKTNDTIRIPFTDQAFDSNGIIVFKNIYALAESTNRNNS